MEFIDMAQKGKEISIRFQPIGWKSLLQRKGGSSRILILKSVVRGLCLERGLPIFSYVGEDRQGRNVMISYLDGKPRMEIDYEESETTWMGGVSTGNNQEGWWKIGNIDWTKFNEKYVRLVTGIEKRLKLSNWIDGEWFGKPGISFDVLQEDNAQEQQKQYTVTSPMLIRLLKPILLKAEREERDSITVSIVRTGEGPNTRYAVNELLSMDEVWPKCSTRNAKKPW